MKKGWILILMVLSLTLSSCSGEVVNLSNFNNDYKEEYALEEDLSGVSSLLIESDVGDISIRSSDSNQTSLSFKKGVRHNDEVSGQEVLDNLEIIHEISGDSYTIRVVDRNKSNKVNNKYDNLYVDMEIELAKSIEDINVFLDVGDIELEGLSSSLNLKNNVGDLRIRDHKLKGDLNLELDVGDLDIDIAKVESPSIIDIESDVGDVELSLDGGSELIKSLSIDIDVGDIDLDMEKRPGELRLETDTGDVFTNFRSE